MYLDEIIHSMLPPIKVKNTRGDMIVEIDKDFKIYLHTETGKNEIAAYTLIELMRKNKIFDDWYIVPEVE